jgi:NAD(P)-dependent dehydrogenase (short-subunit alcohol dehydrogenase family)
LFNLDRPALGGREQIVMDNRVAVVTGGSQGLGLALVERLLDRGWAVITDGRREDKLDQARGALGAAASEGTLVAIAGDITDAAHRREIAAATRTLGGTVSLVINNASTLGASPLPPLDSIELDVLRRTFEVNVIAPLALVQALADQLPAGATVINITSDAAVEAYPQWGGYGASKAALEHAGAVLALERPQWRVLTVDPGDMRTEMHQDAFPGEDISDRPAPDASASAIVRLIEGSAPSGRYAASALAEELVP